MNLRRFFIKIIVSIALLIFVIYISSRPKGTFESAKHFFNVTFKENIHFSGINGFVEKNFGTISAFLPTELQNSEEDYSPVSGKVGYEFRKVDDGFIVDTGDCEILALANGVVTFVGENEDGGINVEVELTDGSSAVYCDLASVCVRTYQHVQRGEFIGTTGPSGEYLLQDEGSRRLLD